MEFQQKLFNLHLNKWMKSLPSRLPHKQTNKQTPRLVDCRRARDGKHALSGSACSGRREQRKDRRKGVFVRLYRCLIHACPSPPPPSFRLRAPEEVGELVFRCSGAQTWQRSEEVRRLPSTSPRGRLPAALPRHFQRRVRSLR